MRIALVIVVIIAAVLIALWTVGDGWRGLLPEPPDDESVETRSSDAVSGSGIIQARDDVVISAGMAGHVAYVGVQEGDHVEAGTVLVRLDDELLLTQIAQAEAAVEAAQANLSSVQAGPLGPEIEAAEATVQTATAQEAAAYAAVDIARAELRAAQAVQRGVQARYRRLAAGATDRELELAQLGADLARNALWERQARRDAARAGMDDPLSVPVVIGGLDLGTMVVANPSAPTQWDVDIAQSTVAEAEVSVTVADLLYEQLKAGARAEDVDIAGARVAQAQAGELIAQTQVRRAEQATGLAEAQSHQSEAHSSMITAGARAEAVAVAAAQLDEAKAEAAILEVKRGQLSLRTPIDGIVAQRIVHEGETVLAGARLLTISALDPVILTIYVPEDEIGRVVVGQSAEVQVDAYPGRAFHGEVIRVSSRAEFTPRNVRTKDERVNTVFGVDIELPNPDLSLRPGMPADATLRTD